MGDADTEAFEHYDDPANRDPAPNATAVRRPVEPARARPVLCITRGLPAAGKTTWARAWVSQDPANRTRINRDDLRFMMFNSYVIPYEHERVVTEIQNRMVERLLKSGKSVVVDDTNLRLKYAHNWRDIAHAVGADFQVHDMTAVPLSQAIAQDRARANNGGRCVGDDVIRNFYDRYVRGGVSQIQPVAEKTGPGGRLYEQDWELPAAWLVDIDGTLARMVSRGPFEWERVGEDELVEGVHAIISALTFADDKIVVVSGRDSICRPQTEEWLDRHGIDYHALFMRAENDTRKDSIVKSEIFWRDIAPNYCVLGVFDDRNQVVEMWRDMGLFCAQVAPGDF